MIPGRRAHLGTTSVSQSINLRDELELASELSERS